METSKRKAERKGEKRETKRKRFSCDLCTDKTFSKKKEWRAHLDSHLTEEEALGGDMKTVTIREIPEHVGPMELLPVIEDRITQSLENYLKEKGSLKTYISMQVQFSKDKGDRKETQEPHFRGKNFIVLKKEDIPDSFNDSQQKICESFSKYQNQGSNWTLEKVLKVNIQICRYTPLKGSSYIKLPRKLEAKKAIINVKNKDSKCFMWSVLAATKSHKVKYHAERVNNYKPYENELNFDGLAFPIKVSDISIFEKQNNISITLFGYEEKRGVYIIHRPTRTVKHHVNLLLISNERTDHYCWVKDLNKLLFDQKSNDHRHFYCPRCFQGSKKKDHLQEHFCIDSPPKDIMPTCQNNRLKFKDVSKQHDVPFVIYADFETYMEKISSASPDPSSTYTEKRAEHKPSGFAYKVVCSVDNSLSGEPVIYRGADAADKFLNKMLEEKKKILDILHNPKTIKMTEDDKLNYERATHCYICEKPLKTQPGVSEKGTEEEQEGENDDSDEGEEPEEEDNDDSDEGEEPEEEENDDSDEGVEPQEEENDDSDEGEEPQEEEDDHNVEGGEHHHHHHQQQQQQQKQQQQQQQQQQQTNINGEDKVKDHCHVTGKYRGAAHNHCNLNYKKRYRIPVFFHNLRHYDSRLIMQAVGRLPIKNVRCIPKNMETYISFSFGELVFLDSAQFLNGSLAELVNNLGKDKLFHLKEYLRQDDVKVGLAVRKGVYPYSYVDSLSKFDEQKLPRKENFFNDLEQKDISDEDYAHAQNVWQTFQIENLGKYHDLYVLFDTLQLADVFENFRRRAKEDYGLDPANFYTAPGLFWEACLKMTGIELELLTDRDMHLFIEKGLRGGVSSIMKRHAKANHPKIDDDYDQEKPRNYIIYLDAVNLYGHAMSQPLPVKDFRWLNETEKEHLNIETVPDNGDTGYILEVDLDYPCELHDTHNDYPLAPESIEIKEDMLSPYCEILKKKLGIGRNVLKKLVPNLMPKEKYVLHYRNLKFYLENGMKMTKIHRVLAFYQKEWMKPYIDFNASKRKEATNEADKALFKLANNSVFGKSMENVRKYVDVRLVKTQKMFRKLVAKPNFHEVQKFSEDFLAVHMNKTNIKLNKPIFTGMAVLDLSKLHMYRFHYEHMKVKYGDKITLLFTDTDSLCYEIETDDVYADMKEDLDLYDTSNYPATHDLYRTNNKKVIGKMTDETAGCPIIEFVGLRAKMYSLLRIQDGEPVEKKTAKGVKRNVVEKTKHEHYRDCLFRQEDRKDRMTFIRSENQQLFTTEQNKTSLSPYDDKRYIVGEYGISSWAYGHYRISKSPGQHLDDQASASTSTVDS